MQKGAVRIIHNVGYKVDTLFVKPKIIKKKFMIESLTAQILHKARNNLLPSPLVKMVHEREGMI